MKKSLLTAASLLLLPAIAHAHPGHGVIDFGAGITHPLTGIDHLAAMLAVGLWSAQLACPKSCAMPSGAGAPVGMNGRALWLLPAAFLAMMIAGALLAFAGLHLPFTESAIAASVLVLGLLITFTLRMPTAAGMALVALFATFHGYAHGAEIHPAASALPYATGFLLATALLHTAGIALGLAFAKTHRPAFTRLAGAALVACSLLLFAGLL